jgi:hypothetical protein
MIVRQNYGSAFSSCSPTCAPEGIPVARMNNACSIMCRQVRDNDRTMIVASASIRTIEHYRQHNLHEKCLSGVISGEPSGTRTQDL